MTRQFKFAIRAIRLATMTGIAIAGAAWITRGPDASLLPDMAGPIGLSDGRAVWVQRFEVTVAEWSICHDAGSCALRVMVRPGQSAATTPATGISYPDALQYVDWINGATGRAFRLPRVAEWAQIAASVMPEEPEPLFTDPALSWASAYLIEADIPRALRPSGSFSTTPEGVTDLDGSVWEWTQDCYSGIEVSAGGDRCPAFYVAGLHIAAMSFLERDPARGGCAVGVPPAHLGLRLFSDKPS